MCVPGFGPRSAVTETRMGDAAEGGREGGREGEGEMPNTPPLGLQVCDLLLLVIIGLFFSEKTLTFVENRPLCLSLASLLT